MTAAETLSLTPNLALLRMVERFGNRRLPLGFLAQQLGTTEEIVRQRAETLAEKKVLTVEGDSVFIGR